MESGFGGQLNNDNHHHMKLLFICCFHSKFFKQVTMSNKSFVKKLQHQMHVRKDVNIKRIKQQNMRGDEVAYHPHVSFVLLKESNCYILFHYNKSYILELERTVTWIAMGKVEKEWVNRVGQLAVEVKWKTPCHALLIEFPNTRRDLKREQFFAQIGKKVLVVDVHTIEKVLNINSKGWREQN